MTMNDFNRVVKWIQDPLIHKVFPSRLYHCPISRDFIINPSLQSLYIIIEYNDIPIGYAEITDIDWFRRTCLLLFLIGEEKFRNNMHWFKAYALLGYYIFEQLNLNYSVAVILENNAINNKIFKSFLKARHSGIMNCAHYVDGDEISGNIYSFSKVDYLSAKKHYKKYLEKFCPIEISNLYR